MANLKNERSNGVVRRGLEALRRLDVEAHEALVVGDAHLDLIGAEAAGIPNTILIGTPDWMRVHIPPDMEYTSVETLREAMGHIRELLA